MSRDVVWRLALTCALGLAALSCTSCQEIALAISANIQGRHMPFGTVVDPIFASSYSDTIVGYTRCGDSAIWTGHYLAAESFRYAVTADSVALTNVRAALAGLKSLVDVTGTDVLARCLVPMSSPFAAGINSEESANGIHASGQNFWAGNTSRDQYLGVFFGLGVAYSFVNQADVRTNVQALATRMLDFLTAHAWSVVMPDGTVSTTFVIRPEEQLALMQVGKQVNPSAFVSAYQSMASNLAGLTALPVIVDAGDVRDSYFKFNLDAITFYNLIRLEADKSLLAQYTAAYAVYWNAIKTHMNPHFNMIDRALIGPNGTRDAQTAAYLNQFLERPRRDVYVNLEGRFRSCVSADQSCNPIPIPQRVTTDFLWQRNPFQLVGGGSGTIEGAGIDYILPYWMGRYYKVVGDEDRRASDHR
ncbi:MAG TPA: hypothetical protein VEV37_10055 [Bryobacteraceae bacterium]|nr:hypothetical protein [Bryobacteraceae bacterium]